MPPDPDARGTSLRVLIVQAAGRWLALAASQVRHVDPRLPVSVLPFVPGWVDGLVSVGGRILPQIDLGGLLGLPTPRPTGADGDSAQSVLAQTPLGEIVLRVAAVRRLVDVPRADLSGLGEADAATLGTPFHGLLSGQFVFDGAVVLVVDVGAIRFETTAAAHAEASPGAGAALLAEIGAPASAAGSDRMRLATLVMEAGGQTVAFPLHDVREVYVSGGITPLPGSPDVVLGLSLLRGTPRLALSLARILGRAEPAPLGPCPMVASQCGGLEVVYGCSRIVGIVRYERPQCQPLGDRGGAVDSVLVGGDGVVVSLLHPASLVGPAVAEQMRRFLPRGEPATLAGGGAMHTETRRVLLVGAGRQLCAIPIADVERVARFVSALPVPSSGSPCRAVLEIGGHIMPMADLARLTGQQAADAPAATVVVRVGRDTASPFWALGVSRIDGLADLPMSSVRAIDAGALLAGVGRIGERMVNVIDVRALDRDGPAVARPPVAGLAA